MGIFKAFIIYLHSSNLHPNRKKIKVFDLMGRRLSSLWKENPQLIPIDAVMLVYYDSICFMSLSRFLFSVYESVLLLVVLRTYPGTGQQIAMTRITSSFRRRFIVEHISVCISMLILEMLLEEAKNWMTLNDSCYFDIAFCTIRNYLELTTASMPWFSKLSWRCQDRG